MATVTTGPIYTGTERYPGWITVGTDTKYCLRCQNEMVIELRIYTIWCLVI